MLLVRLDVEGDGVFRRGEEGDGGKWGGERKQEFHGSDGDCTGADAGCQSAIRILASYFIRIPPVLTPFPSRRKKMG